MTNIGEVSEQGTQEVGGDENLNGVASEGFVATVSNVPVSSAPVSRAEKPQTSEVTSNPPKPDDKPQNVLEKIGEGLRGLVASINTESLPITLSDNNYFAMHQTFRASQEAVDPSQYNMDYREIKQGLIGNCASLAALAGLVKAHPEEMRSRIRVENNKDGNPDNDTWYVKMPPSKFTGFQEKEVKVTRDQLKQYPDNNHSKESIWVDVYMAALDQTIQDENIPGQLRESIGTDIDVNGKSTKIYKDRYNGIKDGVGGGSGTVFEAMGFQSKTKFIEKNPRLDNHIGQNSAIADIEKNLKEGKVVTLGTNYNNGMFFNQTKNATPILSQVRQMFMNNDPDVIVPGHAHLAVRVEEHQGEKVVVMQNTWGHEQKLPAEDFIKNVSHYIIADKPRLFPAG